MDLQQNIRALECGARATRGGNSSVAALRGRAEKVAPSNHGCAAVTGRSRANGNKNLQFFVVVCLRFCSASVVCCGAFPGFQWNYLTYAAADRYPLTWFLCMTGTDNLYDHVFNGSRSLPLRQNHVTWNVNMILVDVFAVIIVFSIYTIVDK